MRCFSIFLLYLYFIQTRGFTGMETSIRNYLADRMRYVNEEFSHMKRAARDTAQHSHISRLDFGDSHLVQFENLSEAHTFTTLGSNYLLANGDLYLVAPEDNKYVLTSLKSFPEMHDEIAFIKTTEHNGISFMFVSFVHDTASHLYRFSDVMLEPRSPIQTIKTINKLTDATFFVGHGALYLATASVQGPVTVYKWQGSHFDDTDKVNVGSAIGLSTVPIVYFDPEILVVLRNSTHETESSYPHVYEFEGDKLLLAQVLDDVMAIHALTFAHQNNTYLVVFNNGSKNSLYKWYADEFIHVQEFDVLHNIQQVFFWVQDDMPLIAIATKDNLMVFTMAHDAMQHLKTYPFESRFSKIFSMHISQFFGKKVVLLLGLNEHQVFNFLVIPMSLNKIDIVSSTHQSDHLLDCMEELDDLVEHSKPPEVIESSPSKTHQKIVQMSKPVEGDTEEFSPKTDAAHRQSTPEVVNVDELQEDLDRILDHLKHLEDRSTELKPRLDEALKKDVVVDDKVLIEGALNAETLTAKRVLAKKLNGINWEPERWLTTSGDQTITTPMHIESLKVSDLHVQEDNGLFKDTLSTIAAPDGNQTLAGVMRVASLKADNIFAPQINDVDMRSLYLRRTPARITGHKSFNNVNTDDVHATTLNGKNASEAIKLFGDPKAMQYEFLPLVTVKNLEVETINDVDWRNFSADVFRIGGEQTIRGDVTLGNVKTQFLHPEFIRGIRVEDLLTTTTPQKVDSIVHFRSIHAPKVEAQRINGLDFANDIAIVANGGSTLISGPVTFKTMRIAGNLAINGSLDEFYKQNHIVGTHERDLLQIYNNKVRINGDLHLASVDLAAAAKLFISGNEFNWASFDGYWLKTTNQEIPVHFEAQNGIATPHLITQHLNDIPIDDYMVNGGGANTPKSTTYIFENVTILGDVIVDSGKQHQPDLQRLNTEAVRLNGTYVVRGSKTFQGRVSVESLKADELNNIRTSDLLTLGASNIFGSKSIRNLTVQSANVNNLTMQQLNGIDLQELRNSVVYIDQPATLTNVDFENLTANHLIASKINNKLFNEYLAELDRLHLLEALNKLEVKGNASISKVDRVVYINNVNMPAIIAKMGVGRDGEGEPIRGNLFFDGNVRIKELFVRSMNDIDMQDLIENRLYYRVWPQNVTGRHSFKYLHAPNVYTPQINNIQTTHLINVNARGMQVLKTKNGLRLANPRFKRSLFANITECDAHAALVNIHHIPKRAWRLVDVDNITLIDDANPLARLLNHAVSTKKDNIIMAPTSLHHVHADAVFNRKQINGIDLHRIVSDALMYNATDQVVTGVKEFVKLNAAAMGVEGSTQIATVNGLDVAKLDQSLLNSTELTTSAPIQGRKTFFGGVQADRLTTPVASGVLPDNLVSLANLRPIPKATFDDLSVLNALNIGMVNNVNFSQFLDDRLLLNAGHDQIATANYYFETLQLGGKTTMSSINDIQLDDVVFDEGLQVINVPKRFTQNVEVQGDAMIEILNGIPVSDMYQQSILLQEEAHLLGDVNLQSPSQVTGNIQTKNVNGVPFDHISELLNSDNHRVRIEVINDALHQIEGLVTKNTDVIKRLPHGYLYLERSDDYQIALEHAHNAQVIEKKDGVLMHVHTSQPGETCGLPNDCECPNQQTIKIQQTTSHHFLDNKYAQRIYSYEDRNIIIDVITNTKSRSKHCSSNATQEFTSVNWYTFLRNNSNAKAPGNRYSYPEHITGFISDVKFFSMDGHVYIILAKLYDATHDTTELDSLVLRMSQDNTKVEHVGNLRTNGAATLHVFHTAQGVNLVIGNVGSGLFYETLTTDIYMFHRQSKMFRLLRLVPTTGCTSATSIVLGLDSLIILAQKNSPLQVLKYNPFHQSYYFHETILHELPVSSVSVFYTGGFGRSDAYLTAVAENGHFYVFSYHYLIGWKLESDGQLEGLTSLVPLEIGKKQYLFASSASTTSTLLSVVMQGV